MADASLPIGVTFILGLPSGMFIIGLGTAVPAQRYKQSEGWEALQQAPQFNDLQPRSRALLRKVLNGNNGIETRHLSLESLHEVFALDPDALHSRFSRHAPALAAEAATKAIAQAGLSPGDIDAVIISTCTGYLCPGLTSYVSERLGLRPDAIGFDLVGQGCGAALPNLRAAEALISSGRCKRVLSACVEICSAAFYLDDDPGVLISACLFGDGAGAVILSAQPKDGARKIEWLRAATVLSPAERDLLRFEQRRGMLRNILSPDVPPLAARHARQLMESTLDEANVDRGQIASWILHAGGRDVLIALQEHLQLSPADTRWSAAVLRDYGNISSPCVFFALREALDAGAPGGYWWMSSFGAGFTCHGALLHVD